MVIIPLLPLNYDNLIVAHDCSWSIFSQGKMRFSLWHCLFVSKLQNTNVLTCIIADPCNTITMVYPISLSLIRQRYETAVKVCIIPRATPCISALRRARAPLAICSWALIGRSVWFQVRDAMSCTSNALSTLLWSSYSHVTRERPLKWVLGGTINLLKVKHQLCTNPSKESTPFRYQPAEDWPLAHPDISSDYWIS